MLSILLVGVLVLQLTNCEREHKVHNIILYPERHSWCQTTAIQQIVASPGYEPVTIDNTVCVGACYSYSIPSTQPAEPGELIGPYCDSCQPVETKCYHVTLQADSKNTDGPRTFQKRVQIIKKCSCTTCGKIQEDCDINDLKTLELPLNLFTNHTTKHQDAQQSEIPELLHFVKDHHHHHHHHQQTKHLTSDDLASNTTKIASQQHFELTPKLVNLLKSIQCNAQDYDKSQLRELIRIVEGDDSDLNDKNLMEFVNYVNTHNTDDLELDLNRLKDVLKTYKKSQNYHLKKYQHHLGESIHVGVNLEHLIKGPHHSMVLAPPDLDVEEKLNIDSDEIKPNHDGVIIAYENHHQHHHHHHQQQKIVDDDD